MHIILFAVAAAAASPLTPADFDLSALTQMADKVRTYVPVDQFDAGPKTGSVAGKTFAYEITPVAPKPGTRSCTSTSFWSYDQQTAELFVGAWPGHVSTSTFLNQVGPKLGQSIYGYKYFSFRCVRIELNPYEATSGFGAKFTVSKTRDDVLAVATPFKTDSKWRAYWSTALTADAARDLVLHLRVRVRGVLADWSPDVAVVCGKTELRATFANPRERVENLCLFNGKVQQFEVFDVRDGTVLYASTIHK